MGAPVGNAIVPPGLLTSDILPRKVTYCCVTGDELDAYANWGLILNACLTLFGITASASLTCCLAVMQEGLPNVYIARLQTAGWILGGVAIIFLAGSICFGVAQFRTKKKMFSVPGPAQLS